MVIKSLFKRFIFLIAGHIFVSDTTNLVIQFKILQYKI